MQKRLGRIVLLATGVGTALLTGTGAHAQITPFTASGDNAAAIQTTVDNFRNALGTNNGVGGSFGSGRREINWDGVPAGFSDPNFMPANFFNVNSPRGAVFSTPGSGFLVSDNAAGGNNQPVRFGFGTDFTAFSAQKLFTAVNSNITEVRFFVPGSNSLATVSGFGAVFTDVEVANLTSIQFFAANGSQIGSTLFAGTANSGGLSFVGGLSTVPIFRVRITAGLNTIVSNGVLGNPNDDVVVMDDFIYGEPTILTAPEPSALALLATAAGAVFVAVRRRRQAR